MASKTYRQSKRTGKWSLEIRQNKKKIFYQGGFENKEKAEIIALEIFEKLDINVFIFHRSQNLLKDVPDIKQFHR